MTSAPSVPGNGRLAVIVLTCNDEANLDRALSSVSGWADEIFVLDSMSADGTVEIARRYDCLVVQHVFEDFARQRDHALRALPIQSEWIFFLDADEWMPGALKDEISTLIAAAPSQHGFYVRYRLIWMGRWVRRGYYPTWILRLFRRGAGRCDDRPMNEHMIVAGEIGYLSHDLMHEDARGVGSWIAKHNGYASREARERAREEGRRARQERAPRLFGAQVERKRWIRLRVWNRLPPLVRPFAYFFYRYVLKGGFLDGMPGLSFHFLHALWYPMLIDIKLIELRMKSRCVE